MSYICTAHLHVITSSSTNRMKITYLTVSTILIDEIANSKYSLVDSSLMADVMSFDISLRLIKWKEKLDKLQTHLKHCLSEAMADTRRCMRAGGLAWRNGSWLSGSSGWRIGKSSGSRGERYLILRVRACYTALHVFSFCEANIQSICNDCFRILLVTAMTSVERTWASKAWLNHEQTSLSVFSLRQSRSWPSCSRDQ